MSDTHDLQREGRNLCIYVHGASIMPCHKRSTNDTWLTACAHTIHAWGVNKNDMTIHRACDCNATRNEANLNLTHHQRHIYILRTTHQALSRRRMRPRTTHIMNNCLIELVALHEMLAFYCQHDRLETPSPPSNMKAQKKWKCQSQCRLKAPHCLFLVLLEHNV